MWTRKSLNERKRTSEAVLEKNWQWAREGGVQLLEADVRTADNLNHHTERVDGCDGAAVVKARRN